jgi:hypothetical protein
MQRIARFVVAFLVGVPVLYVTVQACGDKFLLVGRGTKFQRAYATVYPSKIYIFVRPTTDHKAAIRDPQMHKALRQAGHSVSVIEDWQLLEQALKSVPVDLVLVDVAERARLEPIVGTSPAHPDALYVAFPSTAPPSKAMCKLKADDKPLRYLEEIEGTMKTRTKSAAKKS